MPRYAETPKPFNCIDCGRARPDLWHPAWAVDYPPLCWQCEHRGGHRLGPVSRNPDKRLIRQIGVLADLLAAEAYRIEIGDIYGRK